MTITFYPHIDDANLGTLTERIEVLAEAAERYKAAVLDSVAKSPALGAAHEVKPASAPKDIPHAYNWEELAIVLREIREQPEGTKEDRAKKADYLTKLAEIYEVLRAAKMSKLEAVRLALANEASQLRGGSAAVPNQMPI